MIEIRFRAAASNPGSRPWRWGVSLGALVVALVAPVATSQAQDASSSRTTVPELESLRAIKAISIDGGESISITSGAASITLKRDGTIVLKGTDIVIDGAGKLTAKSAATPVPAPLRATMSSEIF